MTLALHLWTGWPIYIVSHHQNRETAWAHAVVKSPKGFFDIWGLGNLEACEKAIEVRTAPDWQCFNSMAHRSEGALELAIPLARTILAHYFPGETFKDTYTRRSFIKRFSGL